jgi:glycosyltransferase involved in cell wall biosynthesis
MNTIAILIPVYNNPATIQKVTQESLDLGFVVLVVDDGSEVEVSSLLESHPNLHILRHPTNQGKGEAIRTGAKEAKERGFDYIVTIDGDGQHYPKEIDHLLPLLKDNHIVIGNRKFQEDVPNSSKFGRAFSNFWIFAESGRWLGDTQSGFRGYPLSILELELTHSRYDFEIEVLIKHLWAKRDIKEVEIAVYYPPKGTRVSHFDKVKDNIRLTKIHSKLVIQNFLRLFR